MRIDRLDHLVLTVSDLDAAVAFYTTVLGMTEVSFGGSRKALRFGDAKINLHLAGHEFEPKATHPLPGSADLCFVVDDPVPDVMRTLADAGITTDGPYDRTGANGPIVSCYLRDPDGNLIELANYR
jgi:catechol 2,3-dioxygenase-like lactoylglutathione lyase family enzyme